MTLTRQGWIEKRNCLRVAATYEISYSVVAKEQAAELKGSAGYKARQGLGQPGGLAAPLHAFTLDISSGGLALVCQEAHAPGTYLMVEMKLPGLPQPIHVLCLVMRAEGEESGARKTGLQTVAINQDDLKNLEDFLQSQK